ncbi:hypothetical protein D9756_002220 [Leucocoprinus leucothites]|uniref:Uncharacterized protein n=1 Tax=Leucocoprinus leucothites TaxID=201217 RepID=A0A8H5GCA4_9AGAR|nr:hypothetical protein D9756_002220 [Leucoagaricus leucothites]
MSIPYKPQGLHGLPSPRSKVTGEELRFTSLAGQYHGTAPAPFIPPASMMLLPPLQSIPPPPLTHTPSAPWVSGPLSASSGGLMSLDGFVVPHVSSSSNAYVRRDFPEDVYLQVKRHVNDMVKHPCEKTLRYKINCTLQDCRSFIVRTKWQMRYRSKLFFFRARRRWEDKKVHSMQVPNPKPCV